MSLKKKEISGLTSMTGISSPDIQNAHSWIA